MQRRRQTAMALCVVVAAAACSSSEGDAPTTSTATTETTSLSTTTTVVANSSEDPLAAVFSAIEAQNRGDIDAYLASLTGRELAFQQGVNAAEAFSYANATTELVDCRVDGKTSAGESIVECESTSTDDFYSTGGIVSSGTMMFFVTEDDKISGISNPLDGGEWGQTEFAVFNVAFFSWLMDSHPAIFDDIAFRTPDLDSIPGLTVDPSDPHQPDEMRIALEYVAEFVAQSDIYPITRYASPDKVLVDYQEARNSGDVDGVMEFYAEDAVYENHPLDDDGVATGTAEIRALEEPVPAVQGSGDGIEIIDMVVSGNTVTFNTRFFYGADGIASGGEAGCAGGRDSQVTVEDGKITLWVGGSESPIQCLE